jgi:uncharacterized protein
MLILLSPAKTLDFSAHHLIDNYSLPAYLNDSEKLIKILRKLKPDQLSSLMRISAKLADVNFERYIKWDKEHNSEIARQAIFAFKGDVYIGLDALTLNEKELYYLNDHLRILSGLYGVLKPFDLIHEYRLEMGTSLQNPKGADLYSFWTKNITKQIKSDIEHSTGEKVLINLASNEYFKSVNLNEIKCRVITPVFKEYKNNELTFISFFAKKARGLMTRFIATNNIKSSEDIKNFNLEGYTFREELSKPDEWLFCR